MYQSFVEKEPIPISLFHPRWLLDELETLPTCWQMSYQYGELSPPPRALGIADRHASDRYHNHSEGLILEAAAAAIAKLKSLPPGQAEGFALSFKKGTDKLALA
jgi:hypothetical protein